MKSNLFHRIVHGFAITVVILLGAYLFLGKSLTMVFPKYEKHLQHYLQTNTKYHVQWQSFDSQWSRFSPFLTFEKLSWINKDDQSVLNVDKILFRPSFFKSLFLLKFQPANISVQGLNLHLEEKADGSWKLPGIAFRQGGGVNYQEIYDIAFHLYRLNIRDARIHLQFNDGEKTSFIIDELTYGQKNSFRRLAMRLRLHEDDKGITAVYEGRGNPKYIEDFYADAYLEFADTDFSYQLPLLKKIGVAPKQAKLSGKLWLMWDKAFTISAQGNMHTPYVDVAGITDKKHLPLKDAGFDFKFEKARNNDWQLWLKSLRGEWSGRPIKLNDIYAERIQDTRMLYTQAFDLAPWVDNLLHAQVLPELAINALKNLSPSGRVKSLSVQLPYEFSENNYLQFNDNFRLFVDIENASINSWRGTPKAKGIDAIVATDLHRGKVLLDSYNSAVIFPGVYDNYLELEHIEGIVNWTYSNSNVAVESQLLSIATAETKAKALVQLSIDPRKSVDEQGEAIIKDDDVMFLALGIEGMDAKHHSLWLPTLLDDDLNQWLKDSVKAGKISNAGFVYNGSIKRQPTFKPEFQLRFTIDDGQLAYHKQWPVLEKMQADFYLDGNFIDAQADSAVMNNVTLLPLKISSSRNPKFKPLLSDNSPVKNKAKRSVYWINVQASADGKTNDYLDFIKQSPVKQQLPSIISSAKATGRAMSSIAIDIPLSNSMQPFVQVNANIMDNQLYVPALNIHAKKISGGLNYDSLKGLSSDGLRHELFSGQHILKMSQPKNLIAKSAKTNDVFPSLLLDWQGQVRFDDLADWQQQAGLKFFKGMADSKALFNIYDSYMNFNIHLNTIVSKYDLPTPFNKPYGKNAQMFLLGRVTESQMNLNMVVDPKIGLDIDFNKQDSSFVFNKGRVCFKACKKSARPGSFEVQGELGATTLDSVTSFIGQYANYQSLYDNKKSQTTVPPSDRVEPVSLVVDGLRVKTLSALGQSFIDIDVNVRPSINSKAWLIDAKNSHVDASFKWHENAPLIADVKYINYLLPEKKPLDSNSALPRKKSPIIFEDLLMAANIDIEELLIDGKPWGDIQFKWRKTANKLTLSDINGEIKKVTLGHDELPLKVEWHHSMNVDKTTVHGLISADDLAPVFKAWDMEPLIVSSYAQVKGSVSWMNTPLNWHEEQFTSRLNVELLDGRFVNTPDAAEGFMKLFGVFNISNFLKRLRFDFSDIYKSGISFDSITGDLSIDQAVMSVDDVIKIKGPSSRFEISGQTHIVDETIDANLVATFPVANNLPWVAGIVGGIPAVAGAYIVSKIFEEQFEKASSGVYQISGTWSEPKIALQEVFNNKELNGESVQADKSRE